MAGASVLFKFEDKELKTLLSRMSGGIKDLTPAMKPYGEYMEKATDDRFRLEQSPDGKGWAKLSKSTLDWKEKHNKIDKILQQDGYLRLIHPDPDKTGVTILSNPVVKDYAAIHQYGGMAGRGRQVKIPQREFLGFSDEDIREFTETVKDYIVLGEEIMKTLLTEIRAYLRTGVPAVRSNDIFLTPDPDMLPESVKLPCIAIKDGRVTRTDLMSGYTEKGLPVEISVYAQLIKNDEAIESLLDVCEAVVEALDDNMLGDYVKEVSVGDETPISLLFQKESMVIRKTIFMQYAKEE